MEKIKETTAKEAFFDIIKKWTQNDYYTPLIKSEVIFDMLLSEYICDICNFFIKDRDGDLRFITKEFPIVPVDMLKEKNIRPKSVDYLLSDEKSIWLVELKTSRSSKGDAQEKIYTDLIGKDFREIYEYHLKLINRVCYRNEETETDAISSYFACNKYKKLGIQSSDPLEIQEFLKSEKKESSHKYLYQAAQMISEIKKSGMSEEDLKNKKMKLIYIEPRPREVKEEQNYNAIYLDDVIKNQQIIKSSINDENKKSAWDCVCEILRVFDAT